MATEVGKGYVPVQPDLRRFGSDLKAGMQQQASGISGIFKKTGAVAGAAFKVAFAAAIGGVLLFAGFAKDAVAAASNLEESISKTTVVFGDQAQGVIDWADQAATAFGQSRQQALEAASTYGNLFQAFGVNRGKATEMSTTLTELAADLASFNNTSIDDAIEALRSGLSGETEPLKRYGVAINDARLKQQALALGLIDSTKEALDPAVKAQAAYALILNDTALAQGDFTRTSDGLANQQRIVAAQWDNLKATIGKAFMPVVAAVMTFLSTRLLPTLEKAWPHALEAVQAAFRALAEAWQQWGQPIVEWIVDRLPDAFEELKRIVGGVIGGAVALVEDLAEAFGSSKKTILVAIGGITAGLVGLAVAWNAGPGLIITGIAALVAGLLWAYKNVRWFRDGVQTAFAAVQAAIEQVVEWWPKIQEAAVSAFQAIGRGWQTHGQPVVDAIVSGYRFVVDWVKANWPAIADTFRDVWDIVEQVARAALLTVGAAIVAGVAIAKKAWQLFGDDIVRIAKGSWEFISGIVQGAVDVIQGIIQVFAGILKGDWSKAWEGAKNIVAGVWTAIQATVRGALGILRGILSGLLQIVESAMRTAWDAGKRAVGTAIVGIVEFARKLPGQILGALGNLSALLISQGTGLILGLARGIGAAVGGLIESIRGLPGRILSGLGSLGSLLYDAGRALIRGFINGIGSMAGELARKARDVALTPVNVVKGVLGIGSPSKVFAALGRDSVAGYVQGFEQAARGMSGVVGMLSPVPTAGAAAGHWSTTGSRLAPVQPLQINGPIITNRTLAAELIADITAAGRRAGVGV